LVSGRLHLFVIAMVIVALGALINGASPQNVSVAFGAGFWSLITFTM